MNTNRRSFLQNIGSFPGGEPPVHRLLVAIVAAAVPAGLYARFKGLGAWPLGVDEFYISRSIDFIIHTGLPEYPCGGYYTRGLLYQYVVAALRLAGLSPEFAGRVVPATASILMLPAAYLLGRRLHSRAAGLIVVTILSLSVWEVEMARFARMYAPFQAVFVWYVIFFLKYAVDRDRRSLIPMLLLSVVGVLIWEGGVLLGIANLLPPFLNHDRGRLRKADWIYLTLCSILMVAMYLTATADFRGIAYPPENAMGNLPRAGLDVLMASTPLWVTFIRNVVNGPVWSPLIAAVPMALSVWSLRWIWSLRSRWLAAAGLLSALALALVHQYVGAASILLLLLLSDMLHWREPLQPAARPYFVAMGSSILWWISFALVSDSWLPDLPHVGAMERFVALVFEFASFPNVIDGIARPWGRTIPIVSLLLFAALAAASIRSILDRHSKPTVLSALLVMVLTLVLAIGASDAPRSETRYAFFLYPLLISVAVAVVARAHEFFAGSIRRFSAAAVPIVALALFFISEDFQPYHLATIDSEATNYRLGMSAIETSHYYPHNDVRSAATWLIEHVTADDVVIIGVTNVDAYYPDIDYVYLDSKDPRYIQFACRDRRTERWTNKPLVYTERALDTLVRSEARIFILLYPDRMQRLLDDAAKYDWDARRAWTSIDGGIEIATIHRLPSELVGADSDP
jgi:hypothetical protein